MKVWRYGTPYREPGMGAVPREGLIGCDYTRGIAPSGRMVWGYADYDRKLTDAEVNDFELEFIVEVGDDETD